MIFTVAALYHLALSAMSQQETFSSVSLGVSLPPGSKESVILPQKCKNTLYPLVLHQSDSKRTTFVVVCLNGFPLLIDK